MFGRPLDLWFQYKTCGNITESNFPKLHLKTADHTFIKFLGWMGHGTRNNLEHFQHVPFNPLNTGIFFLLFRWNSFLLTTLRKNGSMDFHKIFSKGWTWHKEKCWKFLECCGLAVNPLNPGLIFLFRWSVFVNNIVEKIVNVFSWNFHEISGTRIN